MKLQALSLTLALVVTSSALKVPLKQSLDLKNGGTSFSVLRPGGALSKNVLATASGSGGTALNLTTVHDLIYMVNITVGDNPYIVQLDTGSSDLWIKGTTTPLPNVNETSIPHNMSYGLGWASGNISFAHVQFAGISIPSQALLDVSSAQNAVLGYNANGIMGVGFTSLSSIDALLNSTGLSTGRSLLYNLFLDNPSTPNFIAFALERSLDTANTILGSFSIGEYDSRYSAIENNTAIPTWPVMSPKRWNVLLDAIIIGDKTITPTTTVVGAPRNKAVALLDSGTSNMYVPSDICDAIYKGVPGAQFNPVSSQWTVPCSAEIDLALQFAGQVFPMHPLDVTPQSLTDPGVCVGSILSQTISVGAGQFDWLIGDSFLRSVYALYDFGDFDTSGNMGPPYVKLLSLVDPNQASKEFHNLRGGVPQSNITYNAANASNTSTSVTLPDNLENTLDKVGKYLPAVLGLMALNALVLFALVVIGIVFLCNRRRPRATARKTRGRMSPMPLNRTSSFVDSNAPQPLHTYEPVSVALTEDTLFTPPTPAFHTVEHNALQMGHRPKSVA